MQHQSRQANRHLRNPYTKKSGSPRLRLLSTLFIICLVLISILYVLATHAFLNHNNSENGFNDIIETSGGKASQSISISGKEAKGPDTSKLASGEALAPVNVNVNVNDNVPVIAYAISLTSCAETPSLIDGAAILKHSIHLSSIRNQNGNSKYDYQMYAIVHHNAKSCQPLIEKLGYKTMLVDVPVQVSEIKGDFLRENVVKNGCCGELEFIKLWAYTLVDHPFVVHLDLDTVVLQPMDELFNAALSGDATSKVMNKDSVMWEDQMKVYNDSSSSGNSQQKQIDAFFTRDYNMVKSGKTPVGVQGGFLVLRPSMEAFDEYKAIIREGDFQRGKGWGGEGFGPFYGSMTFQGIIPYYYDHFHPGTAVELNRCIYNQMADNPRDKRTVNDVVSGNCRDGRTDCEDCRERAVEDVVTAHFTLCQKPWECVVHDQDVLQHRLCRKLSGEWYRIRADWELSRKAGAKESDNDKNAKIDAKNAVVVVGEGKFQPEHFRGFCNGRGKKGYLPIKID